jgi:hypothetical protein
MRKIALVVMVAAVLCLFGMGNAAAGEWRIPVGITYISGIGDIVDQYEDNLQADGFITESADGIPVGISLQPYYIFDSGLGIGMGIGPTMLIYGDVDFFNLPVNLSLRYTVMPKANTSFYLRAGVSYNLANGDYVEDKNVGFVGAVGIEFMRNRAVGLGLEVGYDTSSIELEDRTTPDPNDTEEFEPVGFTASIFAVF